MIEDSNKVKLICDIAWSRFNLTWSAGGNYDQAIQEARNALVLAEKIRFTWGKGRTNFILGKCFEEKADYSQSQKHHLAALKIALSAGNKILALNEYHNLAKNYNRMGNYPEAMKHLVAALNINKELKEDYWWFYSYLAIGNVHLNENNYPEAARYYSLADSVAVKTKISAWLALATLAKGNLSIAQKNYEAALKYYEKVTTIESNLSKSHTANLNNNIATAYIKSVEGAGDVVNAQENYTKAITSLLKAETLYKQIGVKEGLIKTYLLLSEAYRGMYDYKNALYYLDLYKELSDSAYSKTTYLQIADLKIKYETEKAAAEMKAEREREKFKEKAERETLLAEQKLEQELLLAEQKNQHDQAIAQAKFEKQQQINAKQARYDRLALEKLREEKLRLKEQRLNTLLLFGITGISITAILIFLLLRQRALKNRAEERAEAVHKMAALELQSLRSQLNPHFMFNSLNSLQELILMRENKKSHSYLSRFSKLLRILLENAEKPFIPLSRELEFLELYLRLETLRIPDLQYSITIDPEIDFEVTLIPNMILQPYIENALWHGLSQKENDKQLHIRAIKDRACIRYEIEDNGIGRERAKEYRTAANGKQKSMGLELLSKRFKLLNEQYNTEIKTDIIDIKSNDKVMGTLITVLASVKPAKHALLYT